MKYKLGSFENEWVKIEVIDDKLYFTWKESMSLERRQQTLDAALKSFKAIGEEIAKIEQE